MTITTETQRHRERFFISVPLCLRGKSPRSGFTLIEIMIVMAIVMIIMAVGIPSVMRGLERDDLARAMHDTIEGCKTARDRAILQAIPYEFTITAEGQMDVHALPPEPGAAFGEVRASERSVPAGPYSGFPRHLGQDVILQMVDVNFINRMEESEARVRFFPNGTCDEFTVVYNWKGKQRTAMADIITGQVTEFIRQ
jgi:prepilin-type N-terminal cleavage/methylation domain-containing protein